MGKSLSGGVIDTNVNKNCYKYWRVVVRNNHKTK